MPVRSPARGRRRRGRRTWPQRLLIGFNVMLVTVCLLSAGGLAFYNKQVSEIPRVGLQATLDEQRDPAEPLNFLLVGADNAEALDPSDPVVVGRNLRQQLTDTIMILRVDPNQEKAWLLSLPRDTYVPIAGGRGKRRINEALSLGGPQLLIETIRENFEIPINHFVQVNFYGFKKLVEAVDGVPVYFNWPARDKHTGLYVEAPGCVTLDGDEALAFARSRYFEIQDERGRWISDPTSDHGRIARQQYFVKQAIKRAIDQGARNPIEQANFVGIAQQYVVIDDTLTPALLLDLGSRLNEFNPDELEVFEPYTSGATIGGASVLLVDQKASQQMLDIFRGIDPTLNVLAAVRIEVQNGTGRSGQADEVAADLTARGFTVTGAVDAESFRNDSTTIRYAADGGLLPAIVLARYLDVDAPLVVDPSLDGADHAVTLVVGRDFPGVRGEPRPLEEFTQFLPAAPEPPAEVQPGPSEPATTTTTAARSPDERSFVPEPPPGVDC